MSPQETTGLTSKRGETVGSVDGRNRASRLAEIPVAHLRDARGGFISVRDRGDAGQDTPEAAEPRVAHARSENTEPVTSDSMDASGSMDATEDVSLESGHAEPKAQQLVDDVLVYAAAVVDGTAQKNPRLFAKTVVLDVYERLADGPSRVKRGRLAPQERLASRPIVEPR
jgi:hypothetical protein